MILGGAAMDLNFVRCTSLPSFSSCLSSQSSSPLNSFSALGSLVHWVIPARAGSNLEDPGSWPVVKLVWGYVRVTQWLPKANLRIAGETDSTLAELWKRETQACEWYGVHMALWDVYIYIYIQYIFIYIYVYIYIYIYIYFIYHYIIYIIVYTYIHLVISCTDAYMHTYIHIYIYIHTYIQTYRHTDIQTYRLTDIQTYRHTDIHTYIHTYILYIYIYIVYIYIYMCKYMFIFICHI